LTASTDIPNIAQAKRRQIKHLGAKAPKVKIAGRGFQKRPKRPSKPPINLPKGSAQMRAMMRKDDDV
jgi:hypothetical protein